MLWFGTPWPSEELRAPVCEDDRLQVPVPLGEPCLFCQVDMDVDSQGVWIGHLTMDSDASQARPVHIRCLMENTVGVEITTQLNLN